jgi:hypothetical protein
MPRPALGPCEILTDLYILRAPEYEKVVLFKSAVYVWMVPLPAPEQFDRFYSYSVY